MGFRGRGMAARGFPGKFPKTQSHEPHFRPLEGKLNRFGCRRFRRVGATGLEPVTPSVSCSGAGTPAPENTELSGASPGGLHQGLHQNPGSWRQTAPPLAGSSVAELAAAFYALTPQQRSALAELLTASRDMSPSTESERRG